jgi:two-component system KDP operon response regulator KdpE
VSHDTSILIIDDEKAIRRFLRIALESHNYRVIEAATAREGLLHAVNYLPEVILLDLGLPDQNGMEVLERLREWYSGAVLILSVRDEEAGIVGALDKGADDYVTKPFGMPELLARIRAAMRHRGQEQPETVFRSGRLKVELAARLVFIGEGEIHLTATEYELLRVLVKNAGRVMTHRQLLLEVWGPNYVERIQYLRVYAGHLREKIEEEPARPRILLTEPGVGYRLQVLEPE